MTTVSDRDNRLIHRNKLYFNSQQVNHASSQPQKRLLSEIWDGLTIPFKPPKPCMIYHLVELPQFHSPAALNRLERMSEKRRNDVEDDQEEDDDNNNIVQEGNDNLSDQKNKKTKSSSMMRKSSSRAHSEAMSMISNMTSNTSMTSSTSVSQQRQIGGGGGSKYNDKNKNGNLRDGGVDLSTPHKRLLHQQKIHTTYYPTTRVVVPDKDGLYWELDPSKTYYFEEADTTLTTSNLVLREILPVLPRYDIYRKDSEDHGFGSRNNNKKNIITQQQQQQQTVDSAVQSNIWFTGSEGEKLVRNKNPKLLSLLVDNNEKTKNNNSSSSKNTMMMPPPQTTSSAERKNLISGQRRARTMSSNELFRILNNPEAAHQEEQQKAMKNAAKAEGNTLSSTLLMDEDDFSLATMQPLSILRRKVQERAAAAAAMMATNQQQNSNNNNPTSSITMSQMMMMGTNSQQQQQQQQFSQNNLSQTQRTQPSQQLSVFLSQKGHSGAAREKDDLVKQTVKDSMRFLPIEYQQELQRVLESSDQSWSQQQ